MKITRVYADTDGELHFGSIEVALAEALLDVQI
jgi:hypothetical protein